MLELLHSGRHFLQGNIEGPGHMSGPEFFRRADIDDASLPVAEQLLNVHLVYLFY